MIFQGQIKQVQHLSGKLNKPNSLSGKLCKPTGGKSDHKTVALMYAYDFSKTVSKVYRRKTTKGENILSSDQQNLSNWSKNIESFPQFDNNYNDGINDITYKGGSGYEHIYLMFDTVAGNMYSFEFNFKTSTGFTCSYGSDKAYAFISTSEPDRTELLKMPGVVAKTALDGTATDTAKHYTVEFTATSDKVYIGIDMGYMIDDVVTNLCFSNVRLYPISVKYESEGTE